MIASLPPGTPPNTARYLRNCRSAMAATDSVSCSPNHLRNRNVTTVIVRASRTQTALELAPELRTVFEPVSHIAMDIVNNCNLRCPFCVYDYSNTRSTKVMSEDTFDSALRLIPYVTDGNFWLSCEHEATMHPALLHFIEKIPRQWRRKVMYTTNLARPMPTAYFDALAESDLHHLNISLESLNPEIYERMRKGARWRIFAKNWDTLIAACQSGSAPPRLRYNIMAYRSNLSEIPQLVEYLRNERLAWAGGGPAYLRREAYSPRLPCGGVSGSIGLGLVAGKTGPSFTRRRPIIPPPKSDVRVAQSSNESATQATPRLVTRPLNLRLQYDGRLIVYGEWTGLNGLREHEQFVVTNVHHLRNPRQFLLSL